MTRFMHSKDNKTAKRGMPCTRGTAMSFGFRRRPTSGIPMPVTNHANDTTTTTVTTLHPRSKSAGPEQSRKRDEDSSHFIVTHSSSGRSTPRLIQAKKEQPPKANRFGYRQPSQQQQQQQQQSQARYKDGDVCSSHSASHYNQERQQQQHPQHPQHHDGHHGKQAGRPPSQAYSGMPPSKYDQRQIRQPQAATVGQSMYNSNYHAEGDRRAGSGIPEPVSKYTLHTSHLPLPQYAVRMKDSNSKIAKTAANQSRKVSAASKIGVVSGFKEDSGTEDSGVDSQTGHSYLGEKERMDYSGSMMDRRTGDRRLGRPRTSSRISTAPKSFDVRDVREDDSTVIETSVIWLQKPLLPSSDLVNLNASGTSLRERSTRSPRSSLFDKDNRYAEPCMSMSTTSSEGYDDRSGEEKVSKDRSRSEKKISLSKDASPMSSDDPEYGHGEAMADEYSLSSSDECHQRHHHCSSSQHLKTISNAAKNGALPKSALRSVLLTIEDPAFAAAAATSTTLIDDETSPVDSLLDSPTASITQSDCKTKKDRNGQEQSGNQDDDSPETPTNTSNSLSLSESREFFDDEIADQPGLIFDDNARTSGVEMHSSDNGLAENKIATASDAVSAGAAENSHTLVESNNKANAFHGKTAGKSLPHTQRISRAGSVDTLSPCESIDSDDLMLDYERSDTSSHDGSNRRLETNPALHELDDVTILSELEVQGEQVMRQWTSLLGTSQSQHQQLNINNVNNNNANNADTTDNNNHPANESGIDSCPSSRLLRSCRSGYVDSPRSLDSMRNSQVSSPLKTSQNVQSPNVDSGDEGSLRIERGTYQYMFQDIASIKTMLMKLKRVLQEAETASSFNGTGQNGVFYNGNEGATADVSTSPGSAGSSIADELADLRRQVVFLQGQLEDKDRTIQGLQFQISKLGIDSQGNGYSPSRSSASSSTDTCNAATQTEKTRTVSSGPSLLQSFPQDGNIAPLVSWSDSWEKSQRPMSPTEVNPNGIRRKSSGRVPRTRPHHEQTSNRARNGQQVKKPAVGEGGNRVACGGSLKQKCFAKGKRTPSPSLSLDSSPNVQHYNKTTANVALKSFVTTRRVVNSFTRTPRTVKAVSFAGRPHNA